MNILWKTHTASLEHKQDVVIQQVSLKKKVKAVFLGKEKQLDLRNNFGHARGFYFSQNQMKNLKTNCVGHLSNILQSIANNPSKASLQFNNSKQKNVIKKAVMPDLFGQQETILSLGFQSKTPPSEDVKCDLPNCPITNEHQPYAWSVFQECGHSFHDCCVDENYCPICKQFLDRKIQDLVKTLQHCIFDTTSIQLNGRECSDLETDEDADKYYPSQASELSNVMFQSVEGINGEIGKLEVKSPQTCHKHQQQPTTSLAKVPNVFTQLEDMENKIKQIIVPSTQTIFAQVQTISIVFVIGILHPRQVQHKHQHQKLFSQDLYSGNVIKPVQQEIQLCQKVNMQLFQRTELPYQQVHNALQHQQTK